MKALSFILLLFCNVAFVPSALFAQKKAKTTVVADLFKDIETYIEKARNDWQVPGIGLAMVRNGQG